MKCYLSAVLLLVGLSISNAQSFYSLILTSSKLAVAGDSGRSLTIDHKVIAPYSNTNGTLLTKTIFGGYGITTDTYDDYLGLDPTGKIVVVLEGGPTTYAKQSLPSRLFWRYVNKESLKEVNLLGDESLWLRKQAWELRAINAFFHGAKGCLIVTKEIKERSADLVTWSIGDNKPPTFFVAFIDYSSAAEILDVPESEIMRTTLPIPPPNWLGKPRKIKGVAFYPYALELETTYESELVVQGLRDTIFTFYAPSEIFAPSEPNLTPHSLTAKDRFLGRPTYTVISAKSQKDNMFFTLFEEKSLKNFRKTQKDKLENLNQVFKTILPDIYTEEGGF